MKSVTLTWDLPTTREQGGALAVTDIERIDVQASADNGTNWVAAGSLAPTDTQTFTMSDLDIGTWMFQVLVIDTAMVPSQPAMISVDVNDDSPPNPVNNLNATVT